MPYIGRADMEMKRKYRSSWKQKLRKKQVDESTSQPRATKHIDDKVILDNLQGHDNLKSLQEAYIFMKDDALASKNLHWKSNNIFQKNTKSPMGNTVLHVAVMYGNKNWVGKITQEAPTLLTAQNVNGDTPLHLAAKSGQAVIVETLLHALLNSLEHLDYEFPVEALNRILMVNNQGNTFFHEAICNHHEGIVNQVLFNNNQPFMNVGFKELVERFAITKRNKEDKSVLYLAIEASYKDIVDQALVILCRKPHPETIKLFNSNMQEYFLHDSLEDYVPQGKSPFLAAILKQDQGILNVILTKKPEWIHLTDEEGRTPLHYAASTGYLDGVQYLLGKCSSCASIRDNFGFFPLHLASNGGHVKVVQKLLELEYCPYPREIIDNSGRNILHLAIESGKFNVIRYILQSTNQELRNMKNDKDANGNTPLHLASMCCYPRILLALTWDKDVDFTLTNNLDLTALDVCLQFPVKNPSFRQRLTWATLKSAGIRPTDQQHGIQVPPQTTESLWEQEEDQDMDQYKDRINTLILVSTLIITVTFAAGFTLPAGTNSSDPGKGMALMLYHKWFKLFILCNTVSMYGAIGITIALIWAQLGDLTLALHAIKVVRLLLGITLATLSLAFMAGVHLVISDVNWLATTILVMSVIFTLLIISTYTLFWLPSSSTNPVVRYISYYPFLFFSWLIDYDGTSSVYNHANSSYSIPQV